MSTARGAEASIGRGIDDARRDIRRDNGLREQRPSRAAGFPAHSPQKPARTRWHPRCSLLSRRQCAAVNPASGENVSQILSSVPIAPNVSRIWLGAPTIARKRRPGQFVIIRIDEAGERIPLTIADVDVGRDAIAVIVQAVGKSTRQLCALREGDSVVDVVGPLGRPTHIVEGERVCCIGGGIGTAVVYPIAHGVKAAGGHVVAIIGGRTKELVILENDMREIADEVIVTTDDGSYGRKGLVTDALRDLIGRGDRFDNVVAVGPIRMMQAVCDTTQPLGLKTTVSLNPVMVDGTGMCGGCRVSIDGQPKFVCVDGPEFDGHQVDFAELAARLDAYREEEQRSLKRAEQIAAVGMEAW
jgi:ferredoxin--NADP+ reductase